jgi:hypothetical protein
MNGGGKGVDPACVEVARYFLGDKASEQRITEVAKVVQDAIDDSLDAPCSVCGSEQRDHRGLLICECPCPSTLENRRRIVREMINEAP